MQRGFTLVEALIAAAIVVTITVAALAMSQSARPLAMRSAVDQFDAAVAYAQSVAATSGNGATIVFSRRTDGQGASLPGFRAQIFSGRPNVLGPIKPVTMPPIETQGDISEATLGMPPFSIFFSSAGHATGMTGAVTTTSTIASEPACPGAGTHMTFTFSDPRAKDTRTLPCVQIVSGAPMVPSPMQSSGATAQPTPSFAPTDTPTIAPSITPTITPTPPVIAPSATAAPASPSPGPQKTASPNPSPSVVSSPPAPPTYFNITDGSFAGQLNCNGDAQIGFVCSGQGSGRMGLAPFTITQQTAYATISFAQSGADGAVLCFQSQSTKKAYTFSPAGSSALGNYTHQTMQFPETNGTVYDVFVDSHIDTYPAGNQDPGRSYSGVWGGSMTGDGTRGTRPSSGSGGC